MKNVLIITYRFPPVGGVGVLRNIKYTKYLPRFGWEPIILTIKPDYFLLQDESLLKEIPKSTQIIRTSCLKLKQQSYSWVKLDTQRTSNSTDHNKTAVNAIKRWLKNTLKFIDKEILIPDIWIGWLPSALINGHRILKNQQVDTILCSGGSFVSFLIGYVLSKHFEIPLVLDYRDGWTLNTARETSQNNIVKNTFDHYLEKKVLQYAKKVIFPSKQLMEGYVDSFKIGLESKSFTITNGYDRDDFQHLEKMQFTKTTIAHIGSCDFEGRKWIVMKFLDILKIMFEKHNSLRSRINFLFVGVVPNDVLKKIHANNLTDVVTTHGHVDYNKAVMYMNSSDILLLLVDYCKHIEFVLSNKLFDYLKIGKPIIMLGPENGASAEILRQVNIGEIIDYTKLTDTVIVEKLVGYITDVVSNKNTFNPNLPAIDSYSRKNLTKRLGSILTDAVQ